MYTRFAGPVPPEIQRTIPPTWTYVGETPTDYVYVDASTGAEDQALSGFGKMFKRAFKFTPKSFTPKNILKGVVNTALVTATGGAYFVLPKGVKKALYNVGQIAVPLVAGGALAIVAGPAAMAFLGPKLASAAALLGSGVGSIGGVLSKFLGGLTGHQKQRVSAQITPDQIAQMEQTGQVPPAVQQMAAQAAAMEPMMQAPSAMPVQAGAVGGDNLWMILGVTAIGVLFFQAQAASPKVRLQR